MKKETSIIISAIIIVLAIILIVVGLVPEKNNKNKEKPVDQNEKLVEENYEGYFTREERRFALQEEQNAILELLKDKERTKNYTITTSFSEYPLIIEKNDNEEKITYNEELIKTINNEEEKSIIDRLIDYFGVYYSITKIEPTELDKTESYITIMDNEDYNEFLKIIKETSYLKEYISKYNKKYDTFYLIIYYTDGRPSSLTFFLTKEDFIAFDF